MTLNLLFMTVTFNRRTSTVEELHHNEEVIQQFDRLKEKQSHLTHFHI